MMARSPSVLDHPQVLQVLFHPRPEYGPDCHGEAIHSLRVPVAPGVSLGGRLYPAGSEAPAILFFHGNGEIAADYDGIAPLYTRLGITLLVMDYRGYGSSDGRPTSSTLLSDARVVSQALKDLLRAHELTPARLYVMGRSLGSAPAIEAAYQAGNKLAGLIIESGFCDTFDLLAHLGLQVEGASEERDGAGNPAKLANITLPTLIIHGQRDALIPPSHAHDLYHHSAADDKRLILIPNAGHNDLMMVGRSRYFEAIDSFVNGRIGD